MMLLARSSAQHLCQGHTAATGPGARSPLLPSRRPSGPAPRRTSHRQRLRPVAFQPTANDTDTVTLPLDYYKCLHVSRGASKEAVRKAYDKVVASPPDVGYSQDALFSRAVLLKNAADCLQDLEARKTYERASLAQQSVAVDVNSADLPGALVLLQECGEADRTISLGTSWLTANPFTVESKDVAAAVALAHCDKAADALEADAGAVAPACVHLESALALLQEHGLAGTLQQQIVQTLEDYGPSYCLEVLEQPLTEDNAAARQKALARLRNLLWEAGSDSPIAADRDAFVDAARTHTTAEEQVALYSDLPPGARMSARELLDTALAHVAVGWTGRSPQQIEKAAMIYEQVERAAGGTRDGSASAVDVSVERAACMMLLGEPAAAQKLLGLAVDSPTRPDPSVAAFITENSLDPLDPLPGMCALTQSWLQEAVLGSFRETADAAVPQKVSLDQWFEAPWVNAYLQVSTASRQVGLGSVLRAIVSAVTAFFSMLRDLMARLQAWLFRPADDSKSAPAAAAQQAAAAPQPRKVRQKLPVLPPQQQLQQPSAQQQRQQQQEVQAQQRVQRSAADLEEAAAIEATAAATAATEEALLEFDRSKLEQEKLTVQQLKSKLGGEPEPRAGGRVRGGAAEGEASSGAAVAQRKRRAQQWQKREEEEAAAGGVADDDIESSPFTGAAFKDRRAAALANLQELEMKMWDSEPAPKRTGAGAMLAGLARVALAVAAVVAGVALVAGRGQHAARRELVAVVDVADVAETPMEVAVAQSLETPLTLESAEQLVGSWMAAKAQALGPAHEAGVLEGLLGGKMLHKWRGLADEVANQGWFWSYDVRGIQAADVVPWHGGAAVDVAIVEAGQLRSREGLLADSYDTNYIMRYFVERAPSGGWRIVDSEMLSTVEHEFPTAPRAAAAAAATDGTAAGQVAEAAGVPVAKGSRRRWLRKAVWPL